MNPDVIKIRRSEKAKITIFIFYTLVFVFIFSSLFDEMGIRRSIYFNSLGYGVYVILALGLILCIYFIYKLNIYTIYRRGGRLRVKQGHWRAKKGFG